MEHTDALAMPKVGVMVQNQGYGNEEGGSQPVSSGWIILTRGDRKLLMLFPLIQLRDVRTNLPRASISDAANTATTEVNTGHGESSFL